MRKYCFPLCVIFPLAMGSAQATVTGAFNSGTDNNGALLIYTGGPGTLDTHYTLTGPSGTPAVVVNPNTYPAGNGTWMPGAASLVSLWIGPLADFNPNGSYPFIGSFQYRLVLNAAAGDSVSGRWAS